MSFCEWLTLYFKIDLSRRITLSVLNRTLVLSGVLGLQIVDLENEDEHVRLAFEDLDDTSAFVAHWLTVFGPLRIGFRLRHHVDLNDRALVLVLFDHSRLAYEDWLLLFTENKNKEFILDHLNLQLNLYFNLHFNVQMNIGVALTTFILSLNFIETSIFR